MSFARNLPSSSAKPPGGDVGGGGGGGGGRTDPTTAALLNLSSVKSRMDTLHNFLTDSVNTSTLIGKQGMDMVSTEIASAVHEIIVNGAALLACTQSQSQSPCLDFRNVNLRSGSGIDPKLEKLELLGAEDGGGGGGGDDEDYEIVELDAVEIMAEHIHFCDICGKGFKRDANLRMHMRAHGNQFKTPEALAKPQKKCGIETAEVVLLQGGGKIRERKTRFSCPYLGCNRNKKHKKFRALKSAVCVKNHFKRSHCPKMYSCNKCNKKSFSVMADLKSHLKHCGGGSERKWKCSCGTTFSRKDKLFGHMALFEGHMPAVMEEEEGEEVIGKGTEAATSAMVEDYDDDEKEELNPAGKQIDLRNESTHSNVNGAFFDGLMFDGFDSIDQYFFQDLPGSPNQSANRYSLGTGIDEFFSF